VDIALKCKIVERYRYNVEIKSSSLACEVESGMQKVSKRRYMYSTRIGRATGGSVHLHASSSTQGSEQNQDKSTGCG
jgi:hypothetical protein